MRTNLEQWPKSVSMVQAGLREWVLSALDIDTSQRRLSRNQSWCGILLHLPLSSFCFDGPFSILFSSGSRFIFLSVPIHFGRLSVVFSWYVPFRGLFAMCLLFVVKVFDTAKKEVIFFIFPRCSISHHYLFCDTWEAVWSIFVSIFLWRSDSNAYLLILVDILHCAYFPFECHGIMSLILSGILVQSKYLNKLRVYSCHQSSVFLYIIHHVTQPYRLPTVRSY